MEISRYRLVSRDTTLPRSTDRKSKSEDGIKNEGKDESEGEGKSEGEGESDNEVFVSKYCARICIARKRRWTLVTIDSLYNMHFLKSSYLEKALLNSSEISFAS